MKRKFKFSNDHERPLTTIWKPGFKKNNKRTKKPVNRFLQDGASAGIRSLQTSIVIKLCQSQGMKFNLRLFTHVGFFSKTGSDTFRSVLIYGKAQELEKSISSPCKKIHLPEKVSRSFRYREI